MEIQKITGWHELTIGRWMAAQKATETVGTPIDKHLALLDAIYNIKSEDLPVEAVRRISRTLDWMDVEYRPKPVKKYYDVNGKRYRLCRDVGKWTTAQYVDYASVSGNDDRLDMQMAIILTPEGERYNSSTVQARAHEFREHLTVDVAMDVARFFFGSS